MFFSRDVLQSPREDDVDAAMRILLQWTSHGLEDVRLVNYSVLLDLPGSSSNTITLKNSGECFYPDGQQCSKVTRTLHSQDLLYSYAAYSAKGTLEVMCLFVSVICVGIVTKNQFALNLAGKSKRGELPSLKIIQYMLLKYNVAQIWSQTLKISQTWRLHVIFFFLIITYFLNKYLS